MRPLRSRPLQRRVMSADVPQEDSAVDLLECEADSLRSSAFPDPLCSLYPLHAERRMRGIPFVKNEGFRETFAVLSGELLCRPLEASGPLEDQRFKSAMSAFAERKRFTRPRRMSSCASCSPRCHSSVQKYAWDASTRLCLRSTSWSGSRNSATKTSPSVARKRRRTAAGRVIWPLRRSVRTDEVFATTGTLSRVY